MIKYKYLLILFLLLIPLTGCWDAINIEDRGFVVGTGIDLEEMKENRPIYTITNQSVLPASFSQDAQESSEDAFFNLTLSGPNIYRVNKEFATMSSKTPYYEHLKVLIISEEIAKTDHLINKLFDRYIRDVSIRRGVRAIIAEKKAKDLLEIKNLQKRLPSVHMNQMLEQNPKFAGLLKPLTLGDVEEFHLRKRSYVLPLMSVEDDKVKHGAGAVFHGKKGKMVGSFNAKEMEGLELYQGDATGNVIEFPFQDKMFAFEINEIKNKHRIDNSQTPHINVDTDIILFGEIQEAPIISGDLVDTKALQSMEEAISKEAKKLIEATIQKAQTEYNTDVFHLWQKLQTKHYSTWKEVRDDWEEGANHFANHVTFDIDVKTEIYSVGTSNKTK